MVRVATGRLGVGEAVVTEHRGMREGFGFHEEEERNDEGKRAELCANRYIASGRKESTYTSYKVRWDEGGGGGGGRAVGSKGLR